MKRILIFCAAALMLVPSLAAADIAEVMSYQGVLRDGSGDPVPSGSYVVTFRIYDVETGGSALWTEDQMLSITDGLVNAHLGASVPLSSLAWDVPYWLGITIGGAELVPRTAFTTVPYAAHAGYADTCLEGDEDWQTSGNDIYRDLGNVGIGTATPEVTLEVLEGDAPAVRFENTSAGYNFTLRAVNSGGNAAGFFSGAYPNSWPAVDAAVYGRGGASSRGAHFSSDGHDALFTASPSGKAIWAHSTGNFSGYFSGGGWGIYNDDMLNTRYFMMPTGAVNGYVMTSDATGVATWEPGGGGSDGDWTINGSDMYSAVPGNVGIGISPGSAKLYVYTAAPMEALDVVHGYWSGGRVANFEWNGTPNPASDIIQLEAMDTAPDDCQFIECERGTAIEFAVDGDGSVMSRGTLEVTGDDEVQASITSDYLSYTAKVLSVVSTATGTDDPVAIYAESVPADYYGIGGEFKGGYHGIEGHVVPTGAGYYTGMLGYVNGGSGHNYGVTGTASGGLIGYGVRGQASGASSENWGGYFVGDVNVTGTLYGGVPASRIDHPLDPEGRYLAHAAVQSDEMVNVYSGNVALDARGEGTVEMPDWFEALNQDFRYQLTCIGGFAPVYVAETISGGRFTVAGGEPGMTVSWQVTGVRHDPVALANGISVEQDKLPHEYGKYMHPEAYGMPATAAVHYHEERRAPDGPSALEQAAGMARDRHESD